MTLSERRRKVRLEAVAAGLRIFRIVDDGSIGKLFGVEAPPSLPKLRGSISRLQGPRGAIPVAHIAQTVLAHVAAADCGDGVEIPPNPLPPRSIETVDELQRIARQIVEGLKHAVE